MKQVPEVRLQLQVQQERPVQVLQELEKLLRAPAASPFYTNANII